MAMAMADDMLSCARSGNLSRLQWLLTQGVSISEVNKHGYTALLCAADGGHLPIVQWLLRHGGASISEADTHGNSALLIAAYGNHKDIVVWLLEEGDAKVSEANSNGETALLLTLLCGAYSTALWLLEHGGADLTDVTSAGDSVWSVLEEALEDINIRQNEDAALTNLLRVMVLRDAPPASLVTWLSTENARVVREGAKLRAWLPAYLARRRALLYAHCPLITPLKALVSGYEEPTTTEELWAAGLDVPS
jgi:ankyrin repeat protein